MRGSPQEILQKVQRFDRQRERDSQTVSDNRQNVHKQKERVEEDKAMAIASEERKIVMDPSYQPSGRLIKREMRETNRENGEMRREAAELNRERAETLREKTQMGVESQVMSEIARNPGLINNDEPRSSSPSNTFVPIYRGESESFNVPSFSSDVSYSAPRYVEPYSSNSGSSEGEEIPLLRENTARELRVTRSGTNRELNALRRARADGLVRKNRRIQSNLIRNNERHIEKAIEHKEEHDAEEAEERKVRRTIRIMRRMERQERAALRQLARAQRDMARRVERRKVARERWGSYERLQRRIEGRLRRRMQEQKKFENRLKRRWGGNWKKHLH